MNSWQCLQGRVPFRVESAARHKNLKQKMFRKKLLIELQRYNQPKVNPRWWILPIVEHVVASYIKRWSGRN